MVTAMTDHYDAVRNKLAGMTDAEADRWLAEQKAKTNLNKPVTRRALAEMADAIGRLIGEERATRRTEVEALRAEVVALRHMIDQRNRPT